MRRAAAALLGCLAFADCAGAMPQVPETVVVVAGPFVAGSERAEREAAYLLDERAYGHRVTRENRWYEGEAPKKPTLPVFRITQPRSPTLSTPPSSRPPGIGRPASIVRPGPGTG